MAEELAPDDGALEPLAELLAALSFFGSSDVVAALEEDDGALVEPPEAGALGVEEALDEELSLFFDASTLIDVEPEPEGVVEPDEDDAEPEGAAGVVDEEDDAEPDGAEPGVVVVLRETARSPSRSQPVSITPPSARDTATATVVSLICIPPWVGVEITQQGTGPAR